MTNDEFDELFGGAAAQARGRSSTQREMDLAASIQAVTEEIVLRLARTVHDELTGVDEPLPGRRRRAQLRRQRQAAARGLVRRTSGSSRRPATPAARSARRYAAYHGFLGQPRTAQRPHGRHGAAPISARLSTDDEIARAPRPPSGARFTRTRRRASCSTQTAQALADEQGGRLVPGPHGVRPARARRPLDPRRPALADDAEDAEPQDQVPRVLPALRAGGAARGRRRVLRARRRQPLHAAGRAGRRGTPPHR